MASLNEINTLSTQNQLIYNILKNFYSANEYENMDKIISIINGHSEISLRLIDWFVTNYSKKYFTTYYVEKRRFPVYLEYKLKLKSYKKKRFDPFCRWERINIPYGDDAYIQTTIGQLNFFRWALENKILDYIEQNLTKINNDMNNRNSTAKNRKEKSTTAKTRKKREELSISASKSIKKEQVEIIVDFK